MSVRSARLTHALLAEGTAALVQRDAALARVVARHGAPPMWGRAPGFTTLVQIILEQQVSLASGRAGFARLRTLAGEVHAARVAALTPDDLRRAGLTRQKAEYIHLLGRAVVAGGFDPARLARMGDDEVRAALVALRG
ncbi:MAG: DNA-3-methyladenine glycosylase 2 family protein, partial [Chloroflexota bacterium]